jgi:hypothetical protein
MRGFFYRGERQVPRMVDLLSLHTTLYCTASTDHLTALPLDHPSGISIMGVLIIIIKTAMYLDNLRLLFKQFNKTLPESSTPYYQS